MKRFLLVPAAAVLLTPTGAETQSSLPFEDEETLHYTVSWPSGLSVGEAEMSAKLAKDTAGGPSRWSFEFTVEAAIPGFQVADTYRSSATPELCSLELEKTLSHGKRKAHEKTIFDQEGKVARRVTLGGGKSDIPIENCAKDGLTFLYHLRRELERGRIPPPQAVLFGAPYEVKFAYSGTGKAELHDELIETDKLTASVKGPASESAFLIEVAKDKSRTPVHITIPLEPGNFTLELAPQ